MRKLNTHFLPPVFNVELNRTINELNGIACKTWDGVRADKLQIFSTRSMGKRVVDAQHLNQALAKHASIAAIKAREQKSLCGTLMLFASNSPFDETPCSYKVIKQFVTPTNDTSQILKVISENMYLLYKSGVAYYRVGVGLLDLSSEAHQQGDLFNPSKDNVQLMGVLDSLVT